MPSAAAMSHPPYLHSSTGQEAGGAQVELHTWCASEGREGGGGASHRPERWTPTWCAPEGGRKGKDGELVRLFELCLRPPDPGSEDVS